MNLEMLPAPQELISQTGDAEALCCSFELAFMCSHVDVARLWIPMSIVRESAQFEEVMAAGEERLRAKALINRCRACARLLTS